MSPAKFHAQREPWAFFCTLTFAGKVPSPEFAFALQRRWLDRISPSILRTESDRLKWLSREELGETNGRFHLHVLLGEIPDASRVNSKTCLALMDQWERVTQKALGPAGMARVRVFAPNLDGVGYVLKGLQDVTGRDVSQRGANCYEIGKFNGGEANTVRLARCLAVSWSGAKGLKYALQARERRDAHRVKCEL